MMDRVSPAGVAIGRQSNLQLLQAQLARSTGEIASGRKSDPTRELGVGASLLYRLHDDVQQGGALKNSASLAGERMKTMQTAMTSVAKVMTDMSAQILQADALKQQSFTTLGNDTPDVMASIADLLNTDFQGQKVFGGTDSAKLPIKNIANLPAQVKTMLDAAVAANGGAALNATQAATLMTDIGAMFGGPTSAFYTTYYGSGSKTGDSDPNLVRIGEGQTLSYDVRGDNAAFKDAFQALALTSLLNSGKLESDAKVALTDRAGQLMRGAQSSLTTLSGSLGSKEARLERVAEIQSRTVDAATAQINDLEGADYYLLSDQVESMKIQLNATYAITAQLSKLSLVNYL